MNRLVLSIAILSSMLAAGCAPEVRLPYADATWGVRCDTVMGMCSPPPVRSVLGENVAGNTVSCTVNESADARTVTVSVGGLAGSERYQVQISGARVPRAGGFAAGGSCSVVVTEGSNRFIAPCGSAPPSTEQPCQVEVEFAYAEDVMTPTASVRILCDHMPNEVSSEVLRGLGAPTASATPAELLFYFCNGLTED
jgi:hypothetical protein